MNTITLAIIKPDAVRNKKVGEIISIMENNGFEIGYVKRIELSLAGAKEFYIEHKKKEYYDDLCKFMSSGPSIILILRKKNAIRDWREVMVEIRKKYSGKTLSENAVHGTDCKNCLVREIEFMYKNMKKDKK